MSDVFILSALRTPIAPRGGVLAHYDVQSLSVPVISGALSLACVSHDKIDALYVGNALYGGGNPARIIGLASGLKQEAMMMTIDTQCCSGMDAIGIATQAIRAGNADIVLAGGAESFSRAPRRFARNMEKGGVDKEYTRPPFTPWPERDPDLDEAAANLAEVRAVTRQEQEAFAVHSHAKAYESGSGASDEIVPLKNLTKDAFTRGLTPALCARLPALKGEKSTALTAATISVEADGAAFLLLASERAAHALGQTHKPMLINHISCGDDPENPALAPIAASQKALEEADLKASDLVVSEVMEAYAVQAMICQQEIGLDPQTMNRQGGALARGHPIGASGAINAVRLVHELEKEQQGTYGLATIAAAGGLGSAMIVRR